MAIQAGAKIHHERYEKQKKVQAIRATMATPHRAGNASQAEERNNMPGWFFITGLLSRSDYTESETEEKPGRKLINGVILANGERISASRERKRPEYFRPSGRLRSRLASIFLLLHSLLPVRIGQVVHAQFLADG